MSAAPMVVLVSLCNARSGLTSAARSKWAPHTVQQLDESRLSDVQNRRPDLLGRYGVAMVSLRTDCRADLERPSGNSSDLVNLFSAYTRLGTPSTRRLYKIPSFPHAIQPPTSNSPASSQSIAPHNDYSFERATRQWLSQGL